MYWTRSCAIITVSFPLSLTTTPSFTKPRVETGLLFAINAIPYHHCQYRHFHSMRFQFGVFSPFSVHAFSAPFCIFEGLHARLFCSFFSPKGDLRALHFCFPSFIREYKRASLFWGAPLPPLRFQHQR